MDEAKKSKKKIWRYLLPQDKWKYPVIIMYSAIAGLALTIFYISNALSYLSNDPVACVNCHIMSPEYSTWFHSSHGRNTICNDCHVPHDNIFREYYFHSSDGLRHSFMFTFRLEPQVIHIKDAGKAVVQENCIRCHESTVSETNLSTITLKKARHGEGSLCIDCHREVPHSRVHSLASAPDARVPIKTLPAPAWLVKYIKNEKTKNSK